jgi:hypothetical protein
MISSRHKLVDNLGESAQNLRLNKSFDDATFYGTSDVSVVKERFNQAKKFLVR